VELVVEAAQGDNLLLDPPGLNGADQCQLGKNVVVEEAVAPFAATCRMDQSLIAVEADGFDGEPGTLGHLADLEGRCGCHATLLLVEGST